MLYAEKSTDYSLREYIGSQIRAKRKAAGLNRKTLAMKLREDYDMSIASIVQRIDIIEMGCIWGSLSTVARYKPENLEKLAALLSVLGIGKSDPLIRKIKEIEPNFKYNPKRK